MTILEPVTYRILQFLKYLDKMTSELIMKAYRTKQMSADRRTPIGIPVGKDKRNTFNRFNQFLNGLWIALYSIIPKFHNHIYFYVRWGLVLALRKKVVRKKNILKNSRDSLQKLLSLRQLSKLLNYSIFNSTNLSIENAGINLQHGNLNKSTKIQFLPKSALPNCT